MYLSSLGNTTYQRDCLYTIVYLSLFCHKLIDNISEDLFLGSLFYSTDLFISFYAWRFRLPGDTALLLSSQLLTRSSQVQILQQEEK